MLCSLQIHECRRIVDIYRDVQVSETDAVLVNKTKAGISFCLTWARFLAGSWIARIFRISAIKKYKCFQLGSKLVICWSSCLLNEASLKLAVKIWFVPCGMFQFSCYPHVFDNVLLFVTPIPKIGEYSFAMEVIKYGLVGDSSLYAKRKNKRKCLEWNCAGCQSDWIRVASKC